MACFAYFYLKALRLLLHYTFIPIKSKILRRILHPNYYQHSTSLFIGIHVVQVSYTWGPRTTTSFVYAACGRYVTFNLCMTITGVISRATKVGCTILWWVFPDSQWISIHNQYPKLIQLHVFIELFRNDFSSVFKLNTVDLHIKFTKLSCLDRYLPRYLLIDNSSYHLLNL